MFILLFGKRGRRDVCLLLWFHRLFAQTTFCCRIIEESKAWKTSLQFFSHLVLKFSNLLRWEVAYRIIIALNIVFLAIDPVLIAFNSILASIDIVLCAIPSVIYAAYVIVQTCTEVAVAIALKIALGGYLTQQDSYQKNVI